MEGMPQIPVTLAVEPELRRGVEKLCQAQGGVGCDTALAVDDFIHPRIGYMDPVRKLCLGHVEWLEKLGKHHFAWMGRGAIAW